MEDIQNHAADEGLELKSKTARCKSLNLSMTISFEDMFKENHIEMVSKSHRNLQIFFRCHVGDFMMYFSFKNFEDVRIISIIC